MGGIALGMDDLAGGCLGVGEAHSPDWEREWWGMPEFVQEDLSPHRTVKVRFPDQESMRGFSDLVDQNVTMDTRYIWFPSQELKRCTAEWEWRVEGEPVNPRYPVYIISKGRWESRMTAEALEEMGVPYSIVVEPQEYDLYSSVIDPEKILVLPFSNLGRGSIPARNWVWEHAISMGVERHWILDDNIQRFWRTNRNRRHPVKSGVVFRVVEDFVDRYENVAIAGHQYFMFAPSRQAYPPFSLNTRIYSCILVKNQPYRRWRGRYNEDTDLSLRALKSGWCTVLFYAFQAHKTPTMRMRGGNTDELYRQGEAFDGRLEMARSLVGQHPDVVNVTWKWGRYQHQVDYRRFGRNRLRRRRGLVVGEGINDYGMALVGADGGEARL